MLLMTRCPGWPTTKPATTGVIHQACITSQVPEGHELRARPSGARAVLQRARRAPRRVRQGGRGGGRFRAAHVGEDPRHRPTGHRGPRGIDAHQLAESRAPLQGVAAAVGCTGIVDFRNATENGRRRPEDSTTARCVWRGSGGPRSEGAGSWCHHRRGEARTRRRQGGRLRRLQADRAARKDGVKLKNMSWVPRRLLRVGRPRQAQGQEPHLPVPNPDFPASGAPPA